MSFFSKINLKGDNNLVINRVDGSSITIDISSPQDIVEFFEKNNDKIFELEKLILQQNTYLHQFEELLKDHISKKAPVFHSSVNLPSEEDIFIGRQELLRNCAANLLYSNKSLSIEGVGGGGKTTFAIKLAHSIKHHFDYVLFSNLREYDVDGNSLPLETLLAELIHGIDPEIHIKHNDINYKLSLWNSLSADKKVLVILDNIKTVNVIDQLSPMGSDSKLISTSRNRIKIPGKHQQIEINTLNNHEANELIDKLTENTLTESQKNKLSSFCKKLPLTIHLVCRHLLANDFIDLELLLEKLSKQNTNHKLLAQGFSPISLSISSLPRRVINIWLVCAIFPREFTLSDLKPFIALDNVVNGLILLVNSHLLTHDRATNRFSMHDVVREQAISVLSRRKIRLIRMFAALKTTNWLLIKSHQGCIAALHHWKEGKIMRACLTYNISLFMIYRLKLLSKNKSRPTEIGFFMSERRANYLKGGLAFCQPHRELISSGIFEGDGEFLALPSVKNFIRSHDVAHTNLAISLSLGEYARLEETLMDWFFRGNKLSIQ